MFACINHARGGVSLSLHARILHEILGLIPPDLWKSLRGLGNSANAFQQEADKEKGSVGTASSEHWSSLC